MLPFDEMMLLLNFEGNPADLHRHNQEVKDMVRTSATAAVSSSDDVSAVGWTSSPSIMRVAASWSRHTYLVGD